MQTFKLKFEKSTKNFELFKQVDGINKLYLNPDEHEEEVIVMVGSAKEIEKLFNHEPKMDGAK